jgi:ATP-dependent helicase HrpA
MADVSRQAYRTIAPTDGRLEVVLAKALGDIGGERIPPEAFDATKVPAHLRITFSVESDDGAPLAVGTDLEALRRLLSARLRSAIAEVTPGIERAGIVRWDFGSLPKSIETLRAGNVVLGFPALLDDTDSVSIRVFTNPAVQARAMTTGLRRLLLLTVTVPRKPLERELPNAVRLAVAANGMNPAALADDCVVAAADEVLSHRRADFDAGPWDETGFDVLYSAARAGMPRIAAAAMSTAGDILVAAVQVRHRLDRLITPAVAPAVADAREQLARLVHPRFVTASGARRLPDVLRYVHAIDRRLEKLPSDPGRDAQRMREVQALEQRYRRTLEQLSRAQVTADVVEVGWMLEELRVGLFAQALGTSGPASVQRVGRELARLA